MTTTPAADPTLRTSTILAAYDKKTGKNTLFLCTLYALDETTGEKRTLALPQQSWERAKADLQSTLVGLERDGINLQTLSTCDICYKSATDVLLDYTVSGSSKVEQKTSQAAQGLFQKLSYLKPTFALERLPASNQATDSPDYPLLQELEAHASCIEKVHQPLPSQTVQFVAQTMRNLIEDGHLIHPHGKTVWIPDAKQSKKDLPFFDIPVNQELMKNKKTNFFLPIDLGDHFALLYFHRADAQWHYYDPTGALPTQEIATSLAALNIKATNELKDHQPPEDSGVFILDKMHQCLSGKMQPTTPDASTQIRPGLGKFLRDHLIMQTQKSNLIASRDSLAVPAAEDLTELATLPAAPPLQASQASIQITHGTPASALSKNIMIDQQQPFVWSFANTASYPDRLLQATTNLALKTAAEFQALQGKYVTDLCLLSDPNAQFISTPPFRFTLACIKPVKIHKSSFQKGLAGDPVALNPDIHSALKKQIYHFLATAKSKGHTALIIPEYALDPTLSAAEKKLVDSIIASLFQELLTSHFANDAFHLTFALTREKGPSGLSRDPTALYTAVFTNGAHPVASLNGTAIPPKAAPSTSPPSPSFREKIGASVVDLDKGAELGGDAVSFTANALNAYYNHPAIVQTQPDGRIFSFDPQQKRDFGDLSQGERYFIPLFLEKKRRFALIYKESGAWHYFDPKGEEPGVELKDALKADLQLDPLVPPAADGESSVSVLRKIHERLAYFAPIGEQWADKPNSGHTDYREFLAKEFMPQLVPLLAEKLVDKAAPLPRFETIESLEQLASKPPLFTVSIQNEPRNALDILTDDSLNLSSPLLFSFVTPEVSNGELRIAGALDDRIPKDKSIYIPELTLLRNGPGKFFSQATAPKKTAVAQYSVPTLTPDNFKPQSSHLKEEDKRGIKTVLEACIQLAMSKGHKTLFIPELPAGGGLNQAQKEALFLEMQNICTAAKVAQQGCFIALVRS